MLVPRCFAQSYIGTKPALLSFSPELSSFYIPQLVCPLTHRLRFDEGIRALELDLDLRNGGRYVIGRIPLVRADALYDILERFLEHDCRLLQTPFGETRPVLLAVSLPSACPTYNCCFCRAHEARSVTFMTRKSPYI